MEAPHAFSSREVGVRWRGQAGAPLPAGLSTPSLQPDHNPAMGPCCPLLATRAKHSPGSAPSL